MYFWGYMHPRLGTPVLEEVKNLEQYFKDWPGMKTITLTI